MIQQGARLKRERKQQTLNMMARIEESDKRNKINTSSPLTDQLSRLRTELRLRFMDEYEKASRRLKLVYYTSGNRAGKLLANRLKGHRYKSQIPYICHPVTKAKQYHPQAIAGAFSHYYGSL